MAFASVYPHYINKAERKGQTKENVDEIIFWLTGYNAQSLQQIIENKTDFETFFAEAPNLNPNVSKITGVICGVSRRRNRRRTHAKNSLFRQANRRVSKRKNYG